MLFFAGIGEPKKKITGMIAVRKRRAEILGSALCNSST